MVVLRLEQRDSQRLPVEQELRVDIQRLPMEQAQWPARIQCLPSALRDFRCRRVVLGLRPDFQCHPMEQVRWLVRIRCLPSALPDFQCRRVVPRTLGKAIPCRPLALLAFRCLPVEPPGRTQCRRLAQDNRCHPVLDLVEPVPHRAEDLRAPQVRAQFLRLRSRQQERPSSRLSPL